MTKIAKTLFLFVTIISFLFFSGCEKSDTVSADGYYSGSLVYQGLPLFTAISFSGNKYKEVPSGGAWNQKFPCITKGTYKIKNKIISFMPEVFPVVPDCQCEIKPGVKFECLLHGDYELIQSGKNLIFQRGTGNDLHVYYLTLREPTD